MSHNAADGRRYELSRIAVGILVVLAALAMVLALVVGSVRRAAVDSDQFANRATVALRDDSVRSLIAEQVTDQLVLGKASDLLAARPLIESLVSSIVGGRAFTGAFRAGVRDVHRAVFDRDRHTATLALADVGTMVAAGLEVAQPSLARRIDTTRRVEVIRRDIGSVSADAARTADTIKLLAPLLLLAAIGGVVLLVPLDVVRAHAVGSVDAPDARAAVRGVWDAFLGDLHAAACILAGSGVVIAAAASSLIRPVEIDAPLRRAAGWIAVEPARPWLRVLRGAGFVAVGLLCLFARDAVLTFSSR